MSEVRDRAAARPAARGADPWIDRLAGGAPGRDLALRDLHDLLLRAARHELHRRLSASPDAGDQDDLAHQVADDALLAVTGKLDAFRGESRFTTRAYKFVIFEVSNHLARRATRGRHLIEGEPEWELIPAGDAGAPERAAEQRELFGALRRAIGELTPRQRTVFVAVALNEEPMDVLAVRLDTNRNAIYKNLFDARTRLRAALADAGHDLGAST